MPRLEPIDLVGKPRSDLLVIAERACAILCSIANHATTDEGSREKTEDDFGLDASEIIEMVHDDMIIRARSALTRIVKDFPRRYNHWSG